MSALGHIADQARALALSSLERADAAYDQLEKLLDQSSGVPIAQMSDDDSLAVTIDDVKQESIMQTNRSRRALGR